MAEEVARQVPVRHREHGRCVAQLESFPVPDDTKPTGQRVPHVVLQPLHGGAAYRYPLGSPEAEELMEDHPEVLQLLEVSAAC